MMGKLAHAVSDEQGTIDPHGTAQQGDQTGKEICVRNWYKRTGGWHTYLEPTDRSMGKRAAEYAEEIADNSNYGYSQTKRWTGAKSIEILGVENGHGDFDCSSFAIECYRLAGLKHAMSGYSGSIVKSFLATGKFKAYTDDAHLNSDDYAIEGGVWVGNGHVAVQITRGSKAGKDPDPSGDTDVVTPPYVEIVGNSVNVRQGAGSIYPKLFTAHKGERYPYFETDEDTGWWWIDTVKGTGCITNKSKYTKLVLR